MKEKENEWFRNLEGIYKNDLDIHTTKIGHLDFLGLLYFLDKLLSY